jgi:cation-transporting ATPase E
MAAGKRVLLLASAPDGLGSHCDQEPRIPCGLEAIGCVALSDELRPDATQTLARFAEVGVQLKLLSGDDPHTVFAVAAQAGMPCDNDSVLGRLTPDQKEAAVKRMRANGQYVAMIGDGINDIPALKAANLAIAMQSGSAATRAVADLVLLDDNFAALPSALHEGQRIRSGMRTILQIFLTRVLYMAVLIVMLAMVDIGFPFAPKQNALITLLAVGVPMLAFAAWARPSEPRRRASSLIQFVLPAACSLAVVGLAVYMGYLLRGAVVADQSWVDALNSHAFRPLAQTALTTISILCGLLLLVLVDPHGGSISSWRNASPRHVALAAALLAVFAVVSIDPRLRALFELQPLSLTDAVVLASVAGGWAVALHWTWRRRIVERLIG